MSQGALRIDIIDGTEVLLTPDGKTLAQGSDGFFGTKKLTEAEILQGIRAALLNNSVQEAIISNREETSSSAEPTGSTGSTAAGDAIFQQN